MISDRKTTIILIAILSLLSSCRIYNESFSFLGIIHLVSFPARNFQVCLQEQGYDFVYGTVVMKYQNSEMTDFKAYLTNRDRYKKHEISKCEEDAYKFSREIIKPGLGQIAKTFELSLDVVKSYSSQIKYVQLKLADYVKPMIFYDEHGIVTIDVRGFDFEIRGRPTRVMLPIKVNTKKVNKKKTKGILKKVFLFKSS